MADETKLLCSLPGIEVNVLEILQSLQAEIGRAKDREEQLHRKLDDVMTELSSVKKELGRIAKEKKSFAEVTVAAGKTPTGTSSNQARGGATGPATGTRTDESAAHHGPPTCTASDSEGEAKRGTKRTPAGHHGHTQRSKPKFKLPKPQQSESWDLVADEAPREKRGVFYVGNLHTKCTEEKLRNFISHKAEEAEAKVTVHSCSMRLAGNGKMSARVAVDECFLPLVLHEYFFARPLYARMWKFDDDSTNQPPHEERNPSTKAAGMVLRSQNQQATRQEAP